MKNKVQIFFLALFLCNVAPPSQAQPTRDGHLYDQGRDMTERSPRASEVLDKMKSILGQWDVEVTTYPNNSTAFSAKGTAEISYMNRGYAYMSRLHIPQIDAAGNEANYIQFLVYNAANQAWALGEADSYSESISMYNGNFKSKKLRLSTGVRKGGSLLLTMYRLEYAIADKHAFSITTHTSRDAGDSWTPERIFEFKRRDESPDFMATRDDTGEPSPLRPPETEQFDFLLGSWNSAHNINLGGQWIQYPSNATAVHALNGHAILEHSWFDVDPSLPDAATTIVRLYNRSMRRWESLYLTNRSNSPLFFGGQKEGENIVLHNFEASSTDPSIPRYVFHAITEDSYSWYAESSTDRGKTFNKTWTIEITRK